MRRPWDALYWWEARRIPFNLAILSAGIVTVFTIQFMGAHLLPPGEDAIEPALLFIGIPAYAFAANVCYSLGWITEFLWSGGDTSRTESLRSRIFWIGLVFSIAVTLAPAIALPVLWAIFAK